MTRRSLMLTMLVISSALAPRFSMAQNRPAAPAPDPAGTYTIEFQVEGEAQTGELVIVKKEDRLSGTITAHEQKMLIGNASFEDRKLTVTAAMPHGELTLTLTFVSNDKLEGTFSLGSEMTGKVTGKRMSPGVKGD